MPSWSARRAAGFFLLIALLAGCGSKGALTLPPDSPRSEPSQRR